MDLSTVEIPQAGARERALEYAKAARKIDDPERRREFEEIARAYRAAAVEGVRLISLRATFAAGGTVQRTLVQGRGGPYEHRNEYLLPRLAACQWRAAFVFCGGIRANGSVQLADSVGRRESYTSGVVELDAGTFDLTDSPVSEVALRSHSFQAKTSSGWRGAWSAQVPIVPPQHRPGRGMGDRIVLWEVENWTWQTTPRPPGDPALLRPIGGDLYAVEAVWDLTELEKLVLAGRELA